mgnify:CR=1 FL=1
MIRKLVAGTAEEERCPSIAWGVLQDGVLTDGEATDTVYRIASMTKSFAALAILQLRDAGKLRLDEPAVTYVPELVSLRYPTTDSALITVRQLLSMGVVGQQTMTIDIRVTSSAHSASIIIRACQI